LGQHRELVLALEAVVIITVLYGAFVQVVGVPAASGLLGHSLGVLGFTMMLMTETLYSLRKRAMRRPRGSLQAWLQFHIFTGVVGPYLVILHSAWSFNGLAGGLTVMTVVVVASGFVGRYIYTAAPRTADGVLVETEELQRQLDAVRHELATSFERPAADPRSEGGRLERAAERRLGELERQIGALRWARRVLATWHAVHIPLGMGLFVMGAAHIGAALYYSTLLR
jgi:hypothetical protein